MQRRPQPLPLQNPKSPRILRMIQRVDRYAPLDQKTENVQTARVFGFAECGEEVAVIDVGAVVEEKGDDGGAGGDDSAGERRGGYVIVVSHVGGGAMGEEPSHEGEVVAGDGDAGWGVSCVGGGSALGGSRSGEWDLSVPYQIDGSRWGAQRLLIIQPYFRKSSRAVVE